MESPKKTRILKIKRFVQKVWYYIDSYIVMMVMAAIIATIINWVIHYRTLQSEYFFVKSRCYGQTVIEEKQIHIDGARRLRWVCVAEK